MSTLKIDFKDLPVFRGKACRTPCFSYCRKLIKEGTDPETTIEFYRGQTLAIKMQVGEGSTLTVRDEPKLHFAKWSPWIDDRRAE